VLHTHKHTHTHTHTHMYMYLYLSIYLSIYIDIHTVCVCVCLCVCVCVCVCVYRSLYIYTGGVEGAGGSYQESVSLESLSQAVLALGPGTNSGKLVP
jgi:hypothetical protein